MWSIRDEWINEAEGTHTVIFHNPEVLEVRDLKSGQKVPAEYHLVHLFHNTQGEVDFEQMKVDKLVELNDRHRRNREYARNVRRGHQPGNQMSQHKKDLIG